MTGKLYKTFTFESFTHAGGWYCIMVYFKGKQLETFRAPRMDECFQQVRNAGYAVPPEIRAAHGLDMNCKPTLDIINRRGHHFKNE